MSTDFSNLEDAIKFIEQNQKKIEAYQKQQARMANYQRANPEKCREKANKYYNNIKENNPEKYEQMKAQKRTRYTAQKAVTNSLEGANGMHSSHMSTVQEIVN